MRGAESWLGDQFLVPRDHARVSPIAAAVRARTLEESTRAIDTKRLAHPTVPPSSVTTAPPPARRTLRRRHGRTRETNPIRWCQAFVDAWAGRG